MVRSRSFLPRSLAPFGATWPRGPAGALIEIRPEKASDHAAIEALTLAAFAHAPPADGSEHLIISALRQAGQLSLSLVADREGTLVGQVTVSPVTISDGTENWFGLGPVAVLPEHQGQSIGSLLIQAALGQLRSGGTAGCVVLGEPSYYGRFGFQADPRLTYPAAPPEYFQLLAFGPAVPRGTVSYHQAFEPQG